MPRRCFSVLILLAAPYARAQDPAPTLPQVAQMIKPMLVDAIPPTLYEHSRNWGKTSRVPHAVHWHGLRPEIVKTQRNDGHWEKIRVTPSNLAGTLDFRMSDPKHVDAEKQALQIYLSFEVNFEYEHQLWESGVRLYSGSTRARAKIVALLDVENTIKLDVKPGSYVPDLVFRLKATSAKVAYSDLVVEHTAGVGGTAAKVIGHGLESMIHEVRPDLEKRLLDKAGAAIVRAADTRDVRIGLGSVLKKRS